MSNFLQQVAPALGTALLGPLGGIAASFLADKLGVEEKTVKAVTEAISDLTPEQLTAVKAAEIDFQKFCKLNNIDLEKIAAEDRDSARRMQIAVGSWVPGTLAMGVTTGFFGILAWMLSGDYPKSDALLVMLGSLGTAWTAIISFYFGSSQGSKAKNELIDKLAR